jgi:hypothetical protein
MSTLIHNKIIACLRDVDAIGKDKRNQQQGFQYRGIDDVYNALHPILAKHGVFTAPEVISVQREERQTKSGSNLLYSIVTMKHNFYAEDGSCVSTVVVGEGMDSGDKATNKAMAIAHKYALFQIFCIPTDDVVDPDSEVHAVAPKNTQPTAQKAVESKGTPVEARKPMAADTLKQLKFYAGTASAKPLIEKILTAKHLVSIDELTYEEGEKAVAWVESELKKQAK